MAEPFVFDDDKLKALLLSKSRDGFNQIKQQYASEDFYCFALYSHGSYSFAYTVASTEEGLTRAAERYLARNIVENWHWFDDLSLEQMRTMLRHSIADSPLHDGTLAETLFKEVCELAETRSNDLFNLWCEIANEQNEKAAFKAVKPYDKQFLDMCFDVLRQLDREGLFGTGEQRQHIVVNLLMADQSREDMLNYAKALNSQSVLKRYETELDAAASIDSRRLRPALKRPG
jgi:hypothetical protein